MTKKPKKIGAPLGNQNKVKFKGEEMTRVVFLAPESHKLKWKAIAKEKGVSLTDLILNQMKFLDK